jgi:hypothetical protein
MNFQNLTPINLINKDKIAIKNELINNTIKAKYYPKLYHNSLVIENPLSELKDLRGILKNFNIKITVILEEFGKEERKIIDCDTICFLYENIIFKLNGDIPEKRTNDYLIKCLLSDNDNDNITNQNTTNKLSESSSCHSNSYLNYILPLTILNTMLTLIILLA